MENSLVENAFEVCDRIHNNAASLYEALADNDKIEALQLINLMELRLAGLKSKIDG